MTMPELEYLMSSQVELSRYVGMWVAVVGKRIVATGETAKDVYDTATEKYPDEEPFVTKLPKEKVMLL